MLSLNQRPVQLLYPGSLQDPVGRIDRSFPRSWHGLLLGWALLLQLAARSVAVDVTAITEPLLDVVVSSPVAGILMTNHVREGDFVRNGQRMVELDKRLEELEHSRRTVLTETKKKDLETTQLLFRNSKSVSKEELEKKDMEHRVAQLEEDSAREQISRRSIAAPVDGIVTEVLVDPGEAVQPYQAVLRIVDTRQVYLVANLEATQGTQLKLNDLVKATVGSGAQSVEVEARITFIAPVVDAASGLLKVKARFDNPEGRIRPGVAARIHLPSS